LDSRDAAFARCLPHNDQPSIAPITLTTFVDLVLPYPANILGLGILETFAASRFRWDDKNKSSQ
jgi:hypothetical protein